MSAVTDVRAYLVAQSLVEGVTGWPCVLRRVLDDSDQLVVITEDGGPAPEFPAASGIGSQAIEDIGVQVYVRADKWDGNSGAAKAQAILDALHGLKYATVGTRQYIRVKALTPEPIFLGFDDTGRPEHTVAFRLLRNVG